MYKRMQYSLNHSGTRFLSSENKNYSIPCGFSLKTFFNLLGTAVCWGSKPLVTKDEYWFILRMDFT